jgi:hypothetical protein
LAVWVRTKVFGHMGKIGPMTYGKAPRDDSLRRRQGGRSAVVERPTVGAGSVAKWLVQVQFGPLGWRATAVIRWTHVKKNHR